MSGVKQGHKFHPSHPMIDGRDVVLGEHYDQLHAANQRLEGEVARLTENLRAIRYAAESGPVSENSRGCVRRIERIAEAALSTNGEVTE